MTSYEERLPLIDKAIDYYKGKLPGEANPDATLIIRSFGSYYFISEEYFNTCGIESEFVCYEEEFEQRAKELGWVNGYRYGVEYPTNGKKPDFMDAVKSLLEYDRETGIFTWKADGNNQVKQGSIAGTPDRGGYIQITLNGKRLKAHRLAFAIIHNLRYNQIPSQIDHIDGVKSNNCASNLRAATGSQNQHNRTYYSNNTSGFKGVTWSKRNKKWQAQIQVNGKRHHIGYFDDLIEAAYAYDEKANELHKEFALTNQNMGLIPEKQLRTETDKLVEQMKRDLSGEWGVSLQRANAICNRLIEKGYRKVKPMSRDECISKIFGLTDNIGMVDAATLYDAGCRFIDKGE